MTAASSPSRPSPSKGTRRTYFPRRPPFHPRKFVASNIFAFFFAIHGSTPPSLIDPLPVLDGIVPSAPSLVELILRLGVEADEEEVPSPVLGSLAWVVVNCCCIYYVVFVVAPPEPPVAASSSRQTAFPIPLALNAR